MLWKTHIWGGIQAGIILAAVTNAEPKTALVEIGAATIGSILPDIDQQNSKISRSDIALSLTSKGLSKVTKHRREVHTVWASFIFGILAAAFLCLASIGSATGFSFFIGLLAALLIDFSGAKVGIPMGLLLFFMIPHFITPSLRFSQRSRDNVASSIQEKALQIFNNSNQFKRGRHIQTFYDITNASNVCSSTSPGHTVVIRNC